MNSGDLLISTKDQSYGIFLDANTAADILTVFRFGRNGAGSYEFDEYDATAIFEVVDG